MSLIIYVQYYVSSTTSKYYKCTTILMKAHAVIFNSFNHLLLCYLLSLESC